MEHGKLVSYPVILSCGPLVAEGHWSLQHEDPMLFVQGNLWDKARREWPDIPYPQAERAQTTPSKDAPKSFQGRDGLSPKNPSPVHKVDLKT